MKKKSEMKEEREVKNGKINDKKKRKILLFFIYVTWNHSISKKEFNKNKLLNKNKSESQVKISTPILKNKNKLKFKKF